MYARVLGDLYAGAEHASLDEFPAEVVRLARPLINFDGAMFAFGEHIASAVNVTIIDAIVDGRDRAILQDYAGISETDPVSEAYLKGLQAPLAVKCASFYRQRRRHQLHALVRKHDVQQLLLFGDAPAAFKPGRWLACFRSTQHSFSPSDVNCLHRLWNHISRAVDINRRQALDAFDTSRNNRATALVNKRGYISVGDRQFLQLLQREWPDQAPKRLPAQVFEELLQGQSYVGRYCVLTVTRQQDYLLCCARKIAPLEQLTPAEAAVAKRFATGMSHREVAQELGVSTNTVRTQISRLYGKLNVRNKVQLCQYLNIV